MARLSLPRCPSTPCCSAGSSSAGASPKPQAAQSASRAVAAPIVAAVAARPLRGSRLAAVPQTCQASTARHPFIRPGRVPNQESRRDASASALGSSPVHDPSHRPDAGRDRHQHRSRGVGAAGPQAADLPRFDRHDSRGGPGRSARRGAHRYPVQPHLGIPAPVSDRLDHHRPVRHHCRRDRAAGRALGPVRPVPPAPRRRRQLRGRRGRRCAGRRPRAVHLRSRLRQPASSSRAPQASPRPTSIRSRLFFVAVMAVYVVLVGVGALPAPRRRARSSRLRPGS